MKERATSPLNESGSESGIKRGRSVQENGEDLGFWGKEGDGPQERERGYTGFLVGEMGIRLRKRGRNSVMETRRRGNDRGHQTWAFRGFSVCLL